MSEPRIEELRNATGHVVGYEVVMEADGKRWAFSRYDQAVQKLSRKTKR